MIAFVSGILEEKTTEYAVVNVNGMGLHILIPSTVFQSLPEKGQTVKLETHFQTREDSMTLFGFISCQQKELFKLLLGVSSIGAKIGLAILSTLSVNDFTEAIYQEDITTLTSVPGIGAKTAKRMVLELKDKIGSLTFIDTENFSNTLAQGKSISKADTQDVKKAIQALEALGYTAREIKKCLEDIQPSAEDSVETIVQKALENFYS